MELFNVINHQQNFGKIQIQKDILKSNDQWEKHFQEIELLDFNGIRVNFYYHTHIDFLRIFKNLEFNYYLQEKKENPFLTPEKYIERHYFGDVKILENILFSRISQEEHNGQLMRDVEVSHFPKHFVSIADDLIYTFEKREDKTMDYVFIIGEINIYEHFQKEYFYSLYKFLKEEIHTIFNELENNYNATQEKQLKNGNFFSENKTSTFINELEVFKIDKFSDFKINIEKNGDHDYNYFLDFLNSLKTKFENYNLTRYVVVSYFTEAEIINYLQKSFSDFKKKYNYASPSDYFAKDEDFKFLANQIENINYYIVGNSPFRKSFRPLDKFTDYGVYKNHLVYYYEKTLYFFDLEYMNSDKIDIHFKHFSKIFDRENENSLRRHTKGYKGDGLEKRIIKGLISDEIDTVGEMDEKTSNKFTVPQIIKILDQLNIKGIMGDKGFTDFQTVQLLADIFGRSEKSIRNNFLSKIHTTTANNYISDLKKIIARR